MSDRAATATPPRVLITSHRRWYGLGLAELWACRELLGFLVWRDVKVRYKQTLLGVGWVVLQPLVATVVFSLLLGRVAKLPSAGFSYPVFVLAGLLPWQLFSSGITRGGPSLVTAASVITRVYFPRLLIPVAAVLSGVVDLLVAAIVLGCVMAWYHVVPGPQIWALPLALGYAIFAAAAVATWLSALNVYYRDVQQALPFLAQVLLFVSPVAYSADVVPVGTFRLVYTLNPVTGVVQFFRWCILGIDPGWPMVLRSAAVCAVLFVSGVALFHWVEDTFADVM
ncbi:MAG TPA: ABC transporter permease [Thermoanaerobaculaceae bacterium]|nr:ABC transporter permease [Thermoanaerobaculaceae bacterium]